ncbi:phage tail protein [Dysgonomonas macrotermitis]|uniref:Phage Tail Collar Domain n=1 Tax=Dysgonomonas macrotermitis TaxID=1346286 RepID=A0A1M5J5S2_9BACT|nr:phage tail protein [Dysgonomonas macrotermitis]SHG35947.1 Phage Tail Collar Domain [Dysgonomonas macrotermitis]
MNTDVSVFLPIGTILSYAGAINRDKEKELKELGWLYCNGQSLARTGEYGELFNAIRMNYGQADDNHFNVPDLRGVFIRGTSGTTNNDPDKNDRTSLLSGGAIGNKPGSYQGYATAVPKNSFKARIDRNNIVNRSVDAGCNVASSGKYGGNSAGVSTDGKGGDLETRPKNKYIYYIIKHSFKDKYNEDVIPPIGSVIPFSGIKIPDQLTQNWMLCDGKEVSAKGSFDTLYKVIGTAHGSSGNFLFNLPDYRDYFLRGVSENTNRDPDAGKRETSLAGGNIGNAVGSKQNDATAYPMNDFVTTIPGLPSKEGSSIISGTAKDAFIWNSGVVNNVNVATGGGDSETRPRNWSVDYYIRFR